MLRGSESKQIPKSLHTRVRLPAGVSNQQTLYVGRSDGGDGRWGNPFVVDARLSGRDLALLGRVSLPSWTREGKRINRARAVALYALWLGLQLERGMRHLRDLCYTDADELHAFHPRCWCAPKACHGDVLVACAHYYSEAVNAGVLPLRAECAVRDVLLGLDYRLPGNLLQELKRSLAVMFAGERDYEELSVEAVVSSAATGTVAYLKSAGGVWSSYRIKRVCMDRLCAAIGLDGGRTEHWWITPRSLGVAIEVSRALSDDAMKVVVRELVAAGWESRCGSEIVWRNPNE